MTITDKINRHLDFWGRRSGLPPLVGVVVGGWSRFLDNPGAANLWGDGLLTPDMLHPEEFVEDYRKLLNGYEEFGDDLVHTAQPFPAVPWLEAMAGCPIRRSEHHFWAEPVPQALDDAERIVFDPANPRVGKYIEFLNILGQALTPQHAVAQSVVRGPADVAAALLGESQLIFAPYDAPEKITRLLERIALLGMEFLRYQSASVPSFHGGSVIGQYEIWAPGWALRLQDDAVSLLSPRLYAEYVLPLDKKMFGMTPYNMFHAHTTSLHILPLLLESENIGAVEISKDEGVADIGAMLPALRSVQERGCPLVAKGRFNRSEIKTMLRGLRADGLCIQVVVDMEAEAKEMLNYLRGFCPTNDKE